MAFYKMMENSLLALAGSLVVSTLLLSYWTWTTPPQRFSSRSENTENTSTDTTIKSEFEQPSFVDQEQPNDDLVRRNLEWDKIVKSLEGKERSKRLPDMIGIGVEKCGTHALIHFLRPHPMIRVRQPMEAHFFDRFPATDLTPYIETMPEAEDGTVVVEKTPAYFSFPPADIPAKIKQVVPDAKLVLLLCDPALRVVSDFAHERVMKTVTRFPTIEDYLRVYGHNYGQFDSPRDDNFDYLSYKLLTLQDVDYLSTLLTTGFYALHLSRWLRHFNQSQLLIINGDDMLNDPGQVVADLQRFLGVPALLSRDDYVRDPATGFFCYRGRESGAPECLRSSKTRTRNGAVTVANDTLAFLKDFYKGHNERLFEMIGRRFDW